MSVFHANITSNAVTFLYFMEIVQQKSRTALSKANILLAIRMAKIPKMFTFEPAYDFDQFYTVYY